MATRTDAVAHSSPYLCILLCLLCVVRSSTYTTEHYSRHDLLDIGFQLKMTISSDFHRTHNIPDEIARPAGSPWIVIRSERQRRRWHERKQKRGCRAGLLARLRKQPLKPLLPSLYLTNARPMVYKTDDLEIQLAGNRYVRDCCVLIITETWLRTKIPDATVQLAGRTLHRWDRNSDSRKSRGGGLCIYVHQGWCNNSPILDRHCSPDLEFMWVRCRPFFLR